MMSLSEPSQPPPTGKKPSLVKRFPVLLPLFVFILLVLGISLVDRSVSSPLIGVIPIEGVILESESIVKKIRILEENSSVKGIIVRINSPGGAVAPAQEIFTELIRLKKKKKIYTSISSVAASGGYYIAVGTEKIFANPGSLTGSIGAIMQTFNVERLMDKLGVRMEIIKSGKNKDLGSAFRSMNPEERKLLETVIQNTHEQFVNAIADNRPLNVQDVKDLADGRFFTGKQALENGLIDGLASFRETVETMRADLGIQEKVQLLYPEDPKDALWSMLDLETLFHLKETFAYTGLFYLTSVFGTP
ncbi:MAG: signal peptide peptidase SppA [Proteobacteria bacterium]|nr:signal peptide peptidase SppA [Pseudomonadota bacterium]